MKIAIVVAADEAYLPAACCAVISCRRAGRVTEPIFLVLSEVSDVNVEAARRFLKEQQSDVEVIRLYPDLSSYPVSRHISSAAYLRLHLDVYSIGRGSVSFISMPTRGSWPHYDPCSEPIWRDAY